MLDWTWLKSVARLVRACEAKNAGALSIGLATLRPVDRRLDVRFSRSVVFCNASRFERVDASKVIPDIACSVSGLEAHRSDARYPAVRASPQTGGRSKLPQMNRKSDSEIGCSPTFT